jgi:hypothetical protein
MEPSRRITELDCQYVQRPVCAYVRAVAYVRFQAASEAQLAVESLNGAVLNSGRGPKLKVLLAEAPPSRCGADHLTDERHGLTGSPSSSAVCLPIAASFS